MDLQGKPSFNPFKPNMAPGKKTGKADVRNNVLKKEINLLPKEILMQRRFDKTFLKVCFIAIRILVLAGLLLCIPLFQTFTLTGEKNVLRQEVDSLAKIEEVEAQVHSANAQLSGYRNLIDTLSRNDSVIGVILTTMEKVIPNAMYLTSVAQQTQEIKGENGAPTQYQKAIIIKGMARDKAAVADFQKSLKDTKLYKNVYVTDILEKDKRETKTELKEVPNELGEMVMQEVVVAEIAEIRVEFDMECILNEWK